MKPKTLILMFVAIGCGLAASYMTSRVIAERTNKEGEEEKVAVLVAKTNLPLGHLIKDPEQCFEEKLYTKGDEPKKAIKSFEEIKEHRLKRPLSAEQFVTVDDLSSKAEDGIAGTMRKGYRAVGLKVSLDGAVAGFVLPNSRVDIITVVKRSEQETFAKIILQNVLVLAADQSAQRPDDKQAVVSSTITVEVTPKQAETLALASELGNGPLRLILRSFGDEETVTTGGKTAKGLFQGGVDNDKGDGSNPGENDLVKSDAPLSAPKIPNVPSMPRAPAAGQPSAAQQSVAEVRAAEPPPAPKTHTMTIYNGDQLTRAVFALGEKGEGSLHIEKSQPEASPEPAPVSKAIARPVTGAKP